MNRLRAKNDFKRGLAKLLEAINRAFSPKAPSPYAGVGEQTILERTTRVSETG